MIRRAKISEIPDILVITKACAVFMIDNQIYQWNEHYPSRQAFKKDIDRGELYVLKKNNKVIGTIVISTEMDAEYQEIEWGTPSERNLYIHRLAIHPDNVTIKLLLQLWLRMNVRNLSTNSSGEQWISCHIHAALMNKPDACLPTTPSVP